MSSLLWPGDHRAPTAMSDRALVEAMVRVEQSWLDVLASAGVAAPADLSLVELDVARLAVDAESSGNPVVPLVAALRSATPEEASLWLHRGLTSQDVLDTALVLCARDAVVAVRGDLAAQVRRLVDLATEHRDTPCIARTLTQPAVPTTFGAVVAGWLQGVLDAADALAGLRWPAQLGGAAGTLSALVELVGREAAHAVRREHARALGLDLVPPWHTSRAPLTRVGDAVVTATDAWGHVARDVLALGRPELGELRDGSGGGSSTRPHKANPTLPVLVRRAALAAPALAATLHSASADQVDQRADGGWHAEWATLATLLRRTVVAASQTRELLDGLEVRPDAMAARLDSVRDDVLAEQRSMAELAGRAPGPDPTGLAGDLVDEVLDRARRTFEEHS